MDKDNIKCLSKMKQESLGARGGCSRDILSCHCARGSPIPFIASWQVGKYRVSLFLKKHYFSMNTSLTLSQLGCLTLGTSQSPLRAHSWDKDSNTELCRISSTSEWVTEPQVLWVVSHKLWCRAQLWISAFLVTGPTFALSRGDGRFVCPT